MSVRRPGVEQCGKPVRKGPRKGQPCERWPIKGATVCPAHGAATEHVKNAAAERLRRQKMDKAVAKYGLPRDVGAEEALLEELRRTAGIIEFLEEVIRDLDDADQLVWGVTKTEYVGASEYRGTNETEAAALNIWLELYNRERVHLLNVTKTIISLNIADRQVRIAEDNARIVAEVLRGTLADLGLSTKQPEVAKALGRRLRALPSPGSVAS